MSQYSTGLSSVTNNSPTVTGTNTLWLANVTAGDSFTVAGDGVMYDVASVDSDTQVTLSAPYAGTTASGVVYAIGTGFTVPDSFPEMSQGDIETATIFTRAMRGIQGKFTALVSDISGKAAIAGQTFTGDIAAPKITATGPFTSLGIDDNATSTAITIDSDENVGIGATNPQYKLDISTDADDNEIFDSIRLDISNEQGGAASSGLVWAPSFSGYTKQSAAIKAMSEGNFFRVGIGFFTGNTSDKSTDAVERMRIDPSGNVGVGTETPAEKLDVDGSIRASTGILFGTDTAAANTLDDYEEGTWTPTLDGVADAVYDHFFNGGWYTKVGNVVTVGGTFRLSSKGSMSDTLDAFIGGLPFTSSDGGGPIGQYRSVASINVNSGFDNGPSGGTIQTRITTNSTSIRLQYFDSGTGNGVYIEGSNVSNGLYMEVSATYSTS